MKASTMSKENYFTNIAYLRFFIPALVANVGMGLVITVDSITVGSTLGIEGLAALSLTTILLVFLDFINFSFCIGGSIRYAKELGSGNVKQALITFNSTFWGMLILSIFLSIAGLCGANQLSSLLGGNHLTQAALQYFKDYIIVLSLFLPPYLLKYVLYYFVNNDRPQYAAKVLLFGNIASFALSVLFVIVCGLGVGGAALATGCGATITFFLMLLHPLSLTTVMKLNLSLVQWKLVWLIAKEGASAAYIHLVTAIVITLFVSTIGEIGGTEGVAVLNVIVTIKLLFDSISESVHCAIAPMISTYLSEKNHQDCTYTLKLGIASGLAVSICTGGLLVVFGEDIAYFLGITNETVFLCQKAIYCFSLAALPMVVNKVFTSYYQVVEKKKLTAIIILLQGAVFILPAGKIFSLFGVENFWWCYLAAEMATLVFILISAKRAGSITRLPMRDKLMIFSCVIDQRVASDLPQFLYQAEQSIRDMRLSNRQEYMLNLVVEEVCVAIVENAFHNVTAKNQYIKITLIREENHDFLIFVRDNARTYNPFDVPTQENSIADLGVKLIRKNAESFFYRRYQGFNSLVLKVAGSNNHVGA